MFCTNCGASNNDDAKFCVNCGEPLDEVQREEKVSRPRVLNCVSSLKKVGFLRALFDFSFNQFVTSKIVKFLYGLSILFAGFISLLFVIAGYNVSKWFGIFTLLIGAPLIFLSTAIYSRVLLEMIVVIFRIADHTANMGKNSEWSDNIQWNI